MPPPVPLPPGSGGAPVGDQPVAPLGPHGGMCGGQRRRPSVRRAELVAPARCGRTRPAGATHHVELANVAALEPNSPVLVGDVVVGSVSHDEGARLARRRRGISVKPDVEIPANAVADRSDRPGMGSRTGAEPPWGWRPAGGDPRIDPGAVQVVDLPVDPNRPSSALSVVIKRWWWGVGQIGDIVSTSSTARSTASREPQIRDLLQRLNDFVGVLATQRDAINATVASLNRWPGPSPPSATC